MRKIIILILTIILVLPITSCQQQQADSQNSEDSEQKEKQPAVQTEYLLKDIENDTKQLIEIIKTKDYIKASDIITSINETWNNLYPEIYKQGITIEETNNFINDLNNLSTTIITFSDEQKRQIIANKIEKSNIMINRYINTIDAQSSQSEGESGDSESESDSSSNSSGNEGSNEDSQQQSPLSFNSVEKDIKLPNELKEETFPEISFTKDDGKALNLSIQLTKHLSKFYTLINKKEDAQLLIMKYYLQNIWTNSFLEDWQAIENDLISSNEKWMNVQSILSKDKNDSSIQITQNLNEISELAKQKNKMLLNIKCEIAIKNIDSLMKN